MKRYALQPSLPDSALPLIGTFYNEISKVCSSHTLESLIANCLNSMEITELEEKDQLSVRLFFEIFLDLVRQGWDLEYSEETLYAIPPDGNTSTIDIQEIKQRIRNGLIEARNEQLREPSVKRFVLEMEKPRLFKGNYVSILDHFVKPSELYKDLERRLNAPEGIRDQLLMESVKPYIQMATDKRDQFTNIRLNDIWRYSRYSWSLPLSSQPGRQVNYLIRDAARDFHPVIGIGALGNSIVQITSRDNVIGWTLESLANADNINERMIALEKGIDNALCHVYFEDLVTEDELSSPTQETLQRLLEKSKDVPSVSRSTDKLNDGTFSDDTKTPVYESKRATELYQLLSSRMLFEEATRENDTNEGKFQWLFSREDGKRALSTALRSIKKRHIGSSIMDITTCGALLPYSELLGGKLVSLLMASPQVIIDYFNKYKNSISEIASRMKGEPLVRAAHLVLLGTTSLYYTGSSQYNRIKVPVKKGNLQYFQVGKTRGYGSVHLSSRTYKVLQELLKRHPGLQPESSAFAAGVNYKMRTIGSGLGHLGLRKLQQHENPRLVYLVPLATNWKEYLIGLDSEPNYLFDLENYKRETDELINYWKERWYIRRISNKEILYRLKNQQPLRISTHFDPEDMPSVNAEPEIQQLELFGGRDMPTQEKLSWTTLSELKDQRASFAERLTEAEIQTLHIETKLDAGMTRLLNTGKRIYLVGSPGDGKTHIIKKHLAFIQERGIFYNLDASAVEESVLVEGLKRSIDNGEAAIVAINEGPLRKLIDKLPEEEKKQLRLQLDKPFLYGIEDNNSYDALVVNLGARQVLHKSLLEGALTTVLKRIDYEGAPLTVQYNQMMLQRTRVKERLIKLLDFLTKSGSHITMHELLGFLSYTITTGVGKAEQADKIMPYFDAIFSRDNPIYRHLQEFDPVNISHPLVDMWLWDGDLRNIEWLDVEESVTLSTALNFNSQKRRFFFESKDGDCLLNMLPDDHRTYYELLNNSVTTKPLAKKRIIDSLSGFFGQAGDDNSNGLQIWTSLKYEAKRDANVFISSQAINEGLVDIYVPRLRNDIEQLIEFDPSHIRLLVKSPIEGESPIGIDIDLELWLSLMKIKRGILNRYQDPVIVRRLTTFMSHLSAHNEEQPREYVTIQVLDAVTGASHQINVSYGQGQKGKYIW